MMRKNVFLSKKLNIPSDAEEIVLFFLIIFFLGSCQIGGANIFSLLILCVVDLFIILYTIKEMLSKSNMYVYCIYFTLVSIFTFIMFLALKERYQFVYQSFLMQLFIFMFSFLLVQCFIIASVWFVKFLILNRESIWNYKKIGLFLFYFIVVLLLTFGWKDSWPQYDNYTYANDINKIYFSDIFKAKGLLTCGHLSDFYILLFIFLRKIPIGYVNIFYLINILLMIADIFLFDAIIRKLFVKQNEIFYILAALMLGVSPAVLGSIYIISPEKVLLFGFLLYMYGYLYRKRPIQFLAAYIVCTSKETGILSIAVCTAVELLWYILTYMKKKKEKKTVLTSVFLVDTVYFLCVLGIGILCTLRIFIGAWYGGTTLQSEQISLDGYGWNTFALSIRQCIFVIKATFFTNFTWIFLLFCFLGLVKFFYHMVKKQIYVQQLKKSIYKYLLFCIAAVFFLVPLCIYVTGIRWRYYAPICALIYPLGLAGFLYFFENLKWNKFINSICVFFINVLLFIQCYFTIDPVMLNEFPTLDTGQTKIVAMSQNCDWMYDITCGVATEYNQQMHTFTQVLDKALARIISESETTCILFSDEHKSASNNSALTSIWGLGYEYLSPPRWSHWNYDKKSRYLSEEEQGKIPVEYINTSSDLSFCQNTYDSVYYIEMPWADSVVNHLENAQYYDSVYHMGWKLKIYKIADGGNK